MEDVPVKDGLTLRKQLPAYPGIDGAICQEFKAITMCPVFTTSNGVRAPVPPVRNS